MLFSSFRTSDSFRPFPRKPTYGAPMKTIATAVLAAASLAVASSALADELEDLMKKYGCNACHSEDKKVIGPSYKDVAAKYKGDASAVAKLSEKVKKGGSG